MQEILSPVKDFVSLEVAISSGCDAVYFGLDQFSARKKASFFNIDNVEKAVSYCHLFNVKAFLTLNTLIKESELNELKELLIKLEKINFDAYIIQDMSVLVILDEINSKREIHASTQMGINNLQGAKLAKDLGFSRVVLARETELQDIKKIRDNLDVEIEHFIHGAICIAYSGSCLFSAIENRNDQSGNRGSCLQNCRMKFKTQDKEGYLISAKDQNLLENIIQLKEAGVNSFKIEGRLKSNLYISSNIKMYKKALNNENYDDELALSNIAFNRGGFSKGYIFSDKKDLVFSNMQNNQGLKVGYIRKVIKEDNKIKLLIYSDRILRENDGIKLSKNNKEIDGFLIQKIEQVGPSLYKIPSLKRYQENLDVSITSSKYEEEKVIKSKKIKIDLELIGKENQNLKIRIKTNNLERVYESLFILERSNKEQSLESIKEKLIKVSDTNFNINNCVINQEFKNLFIPVSVLNKLRRDALEFFENEIIKDYETNKIRKREKTNFNLNINQKNTYDNIIVTNDIEKYKNISKNDAFCFEIKYYQDIKKVNSIENKDNIYVKLPVILTQNEIEKIDKLLDKNIGIYSENISHFSYAIYSNKKVIFGPLMNIYNTLFVEKMKINNYIVSLELEENDSIKGGYLQNSNVELMQFKHCPIIVTTNCDCKTCKYNGPIYYSQRNNDYKIDRVRLDSCSFRLIKEEKLTTKLKKSTKPVYKFI